jgi:hypothetical protein
MLIPIGYVDSIQIIARFMGSAVACRAILMFELAGMRSAARKVDEDYALVDRAASMAGGNDRK